MSDLALTILHETPADAVAIERLHDRVFGPGRYARTAFRLREGAEALVSLCYTAWVGTLLVGSIRLSRLVIGRDKPAVLLGPITIDPIFQGKGVGGALMRRALESARDEGVALVFLVGDAAYYQRFGFLPVPKGQVTLPGPADPARFLYCELSEGAFADARGPLRAA